MKQKKEELLDYIRQHLKDYLPENYKNCELETKTIIKTNDTERTAICISIEKDNGAVAPCIYLEEILDIYERTSQVHDRSQLDDKDFHNICRKAADVFQAACVETETMDISGFLDFENVKDKLKVCICDPERNEKMLSGIPHDRNGDFAQYYIVDNYPIKNCSIKITENMINQWGTSKEEIRKIAMENLTHDIQFMNVSEMVSMLNPNEIELPLVPLYVLTNKENKLGAGVMMNPDIQSMIAEKLQGDYYALPSSIHEFLIVPEKEAMPISEMEEIVREVNKNEVSELDYLSEHVQHYSAHAHILENALQYEKNVQRNPERYGKKQDLLIRQNPVPTW